MDESQLAKVMASELSKGAKVLYSYLFSLRSGEIVNNHNILSKQVVVSRAMIGNYKRELKAHKLLHENKDKNSNIRFMYLGSLNVAADVFADDWKHMVLTDD